MITPEHDISWLKKNTKSLFPNDKFIHTIFSDDLDLSSTPENEDLEYGDLIDVEKIRCILLGKKP